MKLSDTVPPTEHPPPSQTAQCRHVVTVPASWPCASSAGLGHFSPRHASHVTPPIWEPCKVLQGNGRGQGTPPPPLPETPGFSGRRGHQRRHRTSGWTRWTPDALPGGLPRPKSNPRGDQGPGRETLSFFRGMRREHWDRETSGGVSGREQEPSTGGDTRQPELLLCCHLDPRWPSQLILKQGWGGVGQMAPG